MVELGRIDLYVKISIMSSHLTLPRKDHLYELFHIFWYLKKHHNTKIAFDPSELEIDMKFFKKMIGHREFMESSKKIFHPTDPNHWGWKYTCACM